MHVEKLSWAVSLMLGAKRIVAADPTTPIQEIASPFYLLIGFSVENALKAFLEYRGATGAFHRSHDLTKLLDAAVASGLSIPDEVSQFVREIRDTHSDYTFRYPEKAGWVSMFKAEPALDWTAVLIESITRSFPPEDIFGWRPDPLDFLMGNISKPET